MAVGLSPPPFWRAMVRGLLLSRFFGMLSMFGGLHPAAGGVVWFWCEGRGAITIRKTAPLANRCYHTHIIIHRGKRPTQLEHNTTGSIAGYQSTGPRHRQHHRHHPAGEGESRPEANGVPWGGRGLKRWKIGEKGVWQGGRKGDSGTNLEIEMTPKDAMAPLP